MADERDDQTWQQMERERDDRPAAVARELYQRDTTDMERLLVALTLQAAEAAGYRVVGPTEGKVLDGLAIIEETITCHLDELRMDTDEDNALLGDIRDAWHQLVADPLKDETT